MTLRAKSHVLFAYGLAVVASGLFRYFTQEGGYKGLWFGLVMGAAGIASARALGSGRLLLGYGGSALTLLFVGGWFGYESFVLKGMADAETRQLLVFAASIAVAVMLALPRSGEERSDPASGPGA